MNTRKTTLVVFSLLFTCVRTSPAQDKPMESVQVSKDMKTFVLEQSGRRFIPWGFNYDRDAQNRLIEDYWDTEWAKVETDFGQMRKLGANLVRIHLQLGRFMDAPDKPNEKTLDRLSKLVQLAENERLYLDLTGLGCYHKKDVPPWYDKLNEKDRWDVQARFWEAVAARCPRSSSICYSIVRDPPNLLPTSLLCRATSVLI